MYVERNKRWKNNNSTFKNENTEERKERRLIFAFHSCVLFSLPVYGLKCYTDIEGKQVATCNELEGFRTCFTKYNDSKNKIRPFFIIIITIIY